MGDVKEDDSDELQLSEVEDRSQSALPITITPETLKEKEEVKKQPKESKHSSPSVGRDSKKAGGLLAKRLAEQVLLAKMQTHTAGQGLLNQPT